MSDESNPLPIIKEANGIVTGAYGPFTLKTGLQPIFSQNEQGYFRLEAYEALLRPFTNGTPVSPGQFFGLVEREDRFAVERICREIHITNMGNEQRKTTMLFLNLDPAAFGSVSELRNEVETIVRCARAANIQTNRIVCEIIEHGAESQSQLTSMVSLLREHGCSVAIDDYGADSSDIERIDLLRPDIVKFDSLWVTRFMENTAGINLLATMVREFTDRGIISLFEGLEESWQVDLCKEIGVKFMQGWGLARPEICPTSFNAKYPETENKVPAATQQAKDDLAEYAEAMRAEPVERFVVHTNPSHGKRTGTFGRRGL